LAYVETGCRGRSWREEVCADVAVALVDFDAGRSAESVAEFGDDLAHLIAVHPPCAAAVAVYGEEELLVVVFLEDDQREHGWDYVR